MEQDIGEFIAKSEFLGEKFEEVNYKDFYRDIFPIGSFERKGKYDDGKGNGILTSINGLDSFNYIVTDDHDALDKFIDDDFVVISPVSYFGNRKTARNSTKLYGFSLDIDGTGMEELRQLVHQITTGVNPQPKFLVNSGHGVHLYYVFEEPLNLYNHIKESLKNLKFALIDRLWNMHTSTIKEKQFQGIFQGFRMVGSPTKFGKQHRLKAFKIGNKIDLDYLNGFVPGEAQVHELNYESQMSLEEAKAKFPDWYQKVIVEKDTTTKKWEVNRDLYDWWLRKIKKEATFGHRYFCVMVLAIYAKKCNVFKKELEEDAYSLIPLFTEIKLDDPFTKTDVKSALKSYDKDYVTFPRADIEKITAIDIPPNKRNYRNQKIHLQIARATQEILYPDGEWRNVSGRPLGSGTKEDLVKEYVKNNPDKNVTEIARALNVSRSTVYKYR